MTPDRLAIIRLPLLGQTRPAAFVFVDRERVTWVEPSYRDPAGSTAPAVHSIDGDARLRGEGFDVEVGGQVVAQVDPVGTPDVDDAQGSCARALADFGDLLVADGTTLDEERAAIAARLQVDE